MSPSRQPTPSPSRTPQADSTPTETTGPRPRSTSPSARRARGAATKPRTELSLELIITTTCRILDDEGPSAVTFRRLAADLGVGVASLYWYVDNKDDLMLLCVDRAFEELPTPHAPDPAQWRAAIREHYCAMYELITRHPWVMLLTAPRHNSKRGLSLWVAASQILHEAGLDDLTAFHATSLLFGHLVAMGEVVADAKYGVFAGRERRDILDARVEEVRQLLGPEGSTFLTDVLPHHNEREQFEGGLDLALDGIATAIAARR